MNLNAYDNATNKVDKQKTWIYIKQHQLISRELVYRPYYKILTRFNSTTNSYHYYIALSSDNIGGRTKLDDYGRIKINLLDIWFKTTLKNYKEDTNINIKLVEEQDDGEIYELDI